MTRPIKDIVADFLNTEFARNECTDEELCDLIAEMDEQIFESHGKLPKDN